MATAPHSPGSLSSSKSEGISEITGFSTSLIVTVNDASVTLSFTSTMVYVTVVVPTSNREPRSLVVVTEAIPQLSSMMGSPQATVAPQTPGILLVVKSAGKPEIVGNSSSTTVMLKVSLVMFP